MKAFFKKSIELNQMIENFQSIISESLLLFEKAIQYYLDKDQENFYNTYIRITSLESEADALEIDIKVNLYKYLLIPDARADVLSIIKSLDNIIDEAEETIKEFYIQQPVIPECIHKKIHALTKESIQSAEMVVNATRAFFNDLHMVNSYVSKVKFFEHEADLLEDQLNQSIFKEDVTHDLAHKIQLKFFINKIADLSDEAELISEKLTIFAIKREI